MPRVERTSAAESDLAQIAFYIARHDAHAALRFLGRFDRKAELYAGNPTLGELWPDFGPDVRAFRLTPYIALYRALPDGIRVLRVFHTARDVPSVFRGDS